MKNLSLVGEAKQTTLTYLLSVSIASNGKSR